MRSALLGHSPDSLDPRGRRDRYNHLGTIDPHGWGTAMARPFLPRVEGVERRELRAVMSAPVADVLSAAGSGVAPPTGSVFPFAPAAGQPTAFEQARERFTASFTGSFAFQPAQFTSQSRVIRMRGVGTSSQFLHGNVQVAIGLPSQPGGPIFGGAYIQDKNLVGSTLMGLDVNFDPASVDAQGRPTRGAWSVDPNVYSGIDFIAQGTGTVTIRYTRNKLTIVFTGNVYTNGITGPLANTDIQP
jgi:hypothetical protein